MAISMGAALLGSAAIGAATSYASANAAGDAADASAAAQDRASQREYVVAMRQQDFNEQQYADWKAIYGDTEHNLGEYYNRLDPDKFASLGLQNIQREYQKSSENVQRTLAQRGLSGSGIEAASLTSLEAAKAQSMANTRTMAEDQVAQSQMNFLGLGLGQRTSIQGNINNAYNNQIGVLQNQANQQGQRFLQASQQEAQAWNSFGNVIGQGMQAYAMNSYLQSK